MTMDILNLQMPSGDQTYYEDEFLTIIDSHILYFRSLPNSLIQTLDPNLVYKYEGDFYGLLSQMKIPKKYHYAILKINDFRSPSDLTLEQKSIIIPPLDEIDLQNQIYRTKKFSI